MGSSEIDTELNGLMRVTGGVGRNIRTRLRTAYDDLQAGVSDVDAAINSEDGSLYQPIKRRESSSKTPRFDSRLDVMESSLNKT